MEFIYIYLLSSFLSVYIYPVLNISCFQCNTSINNTRSIFGWFVIGLFFGPFGLLVIGFPKFSEY